MLIIACRVADDVRHARARLIILRFVMLRCADMPYVATLLRCLSAHYIVNTPCSVMPRRRRDSATLFMPRICCYRLCDAYADVYASASARCYVC